MSRIIPVAAAMAAIIAIAGCSSQHVAQSVLPSVGGATNQYVASDEQLMQPFASTAKWAEVGHDASHDGYNPLETILNTSNVATLIQGWTFSTGSSLTAMVQSGNTIYIENNSPTDTVYAINMTTGKLRWSFFSGTGSSSGGQMNLAYSGGRLYTLCSTDNMGHGGLCAVNATTGALEWSYAYTTFEGQNVTDSPSAGPTVSPNGADVVFGYNWQYSGSVYGALANLNAATGAVNWIDGDCLDNGNISCASVSTAPAVITSTQVIAVGGGSGAGGFTAGPCALSLATGAKIWCYNSGDSTGAISYANGFVYLTSQVSGNLIVSAIRDSTGLLKWSVIDSNGGRTYEVAIANGVAYVTDHFSNTLEAINAKTGAIIWHDTIPEGGPPSVANGVLYAETGGGNAIAAFNAATGAQLWSGVGQDASAGQMIVNGALYSQCNNNNLCQYKLPAARTR